MVSLINSLKEYRLFRFFYWSIKISLGLGFVLSGLRKMPGVKFTSLPMSNPVGLFFESMYTTGFYWNFIGYYQIFTGVLLLVNWWKRLSPVLAMPVTVNILLVSVSLHMKGTPFITAMMVLGNLFLLLWHWESYLPILKRK